LLVNEMKGDGDKLDAVLLDVESGHGRIVARDTLPVFGWARDRE